MFDVFIPEHAREQSDENAECLHVEFVCLLLGRVRDDHVNDSLDEQEGGLAVRTDKRCYAVSGSEY